MYSQEKSGFGIVSDYKGTSREDSDIPILCETCLGENPYLRIQRDRNGKQCHICTRAYTGFRWKPGPRARYKCTVVCQQCARLKNVCQTCLFDLEYGLPVQVRDKIMGECKRGQECPYLHQELYNDPALADQNIRDRYIGQDDPVAAKILRIAANKIEEETGEGDNNNNNNNNNNITTIYIGGIKETVKETDLIKKFNSYGDILAARPQQQQQQEQQDGGADGSGSSSSSSSSSAAAAAAAAVPDGFLAPPMPGLPPLPLPAGMAPPPPAAAAAAAAAAGAPYRSMLPFEAELSKR
ncbi:RRM / zinc finger (CCCH type) domain-containing protein, putative [Eimeria maxima]|uniref:RRM / zinc finger (CCCH type) domain-containing protein, putative n=1 Tax=Eimeria maxima TaxID=5804 RepID=U6MD58_EIMMA|nr:RRM / zinc finger (CCCH type) domain-containing protein, putative [Eimeria maxima]CDJ61971.1 RRM / zinc finger (CCCH type) domain-containing protein, putative [Eimeria maxima]